jgi:hypothetical protein
MHRIPQKTKIHYDDFGRGARSLQEVVRWLNRRGLERSVISFLPGLPGADRGDGLDHSEWRFCANPDVLFPIHEICPTQNQAQSPKRRQD